MELNCKTAEAKLKKIRALFLQLVVVLVFMLIGGVCGGIIGNYLSESTDQKSVGQLLIYHGLMIIGFYLVIFFQMAVHEGGHLIFGLLSGYRFSSFRIGSLMWVRENGRFRLKRLAIAGTGGQCLMAPPEMVDGKFPVLLYNLGGSLVNAIAGLGFLGLYFVLGHILWLKPFLLLGALSGFSFALMNGIPMRLGIVDNDGYNAFLLGKNRDALRGFWLQLKVNEQISKGIRLKDMPEEWFFIPLDGPKNSMTAALGVFACNRLMDEKRLREAAELMERLGEMDTAMIGLHRNLLACDLIFCELMGENRKDKLDAMWNKQQRKFMKSMKSFPTVLRTEYAYALLAEKNEEKALAVKKQFEKIAHTYPYPSEIESERELMEMAGQKASGHKAA